ncbi:MAG: DUF2752 domain-containing protein [Lachnospiraceae bacterium]|nr:DUF2752 domain-containing protein [Lachnospiraceae bacterium]
MNEEVKGRLLAELKKLGILLLVGVLYAIWCNLTGLGIPCVFRLVFGIKCPGCGMTHAAVAMTHLDIAGAFYYNKLSVTVVPLLIIILLVQEYRYIKTSSRKISLPETLILSVMLFVTIAYGVARNLPKGVLESLTGILPQALRAGL